MLAPMDKNMNGETVTQPGAAKRRIKRHRIAPESPAFITATRFIGQRVRLDLKALRGGVAIVSDIGAAK